MIWMFTQRPEGCGFMHKWLLDLHWIAWIVRFIFNKQQPFFLKPVNYAFDDDDDEVANNEWMQINSMNAFS